MLISKEEIQISDRLLITEVKVAGKLTNTAAHTADTLKPLLEHHLKELRLPTILRECDNVTLRCAVEQVDYAR